MPSRARGIEPCSRVRRQSLLFPDLAGEAPQRLLDGSARIALQTEPRFDSDIFIEKNQILTRSGEIPASWQRRLDLLLGTTEWLDAFYEVEPTPTLFDTGNTRLVKATTETIGRYFND